MKLVAFKLVKLKLEVEQIMLARQEQANNMIHVCNNDRTTKLKKRVYKLL